MSKSYGSRELLKCLKTLGFVTKGNANGRHVKFYHKDGREGQKPFFIMQMGIKDYSKNAASRYIQELKQFGFDKKDIEENLY